MQAPEHPSCVPTHASRRLGALTMLIVLLAGCTQEPASPSSTSMIDLATPTAPTTAVTPSPTEEPSASTAHPPTATPTARPTTASPAATPGPTKARWKDAGSMRWARHAPIAVLLGDGRVLVFGDEGGKYEPAPEPSRFAELWDPATNKWTRTDALPKARGAAAAVTLRDGRVLVIGGLNDEYASYSSTYIYDPATEHWTKTGLLDTARTNPAAAVLRDGRVLVAGGTYWGGYRTGAGEDADAVLAGYRLVDSGPDAEARELATAELYDPETGTWSRTGSMRYARWEAAAVTLGDGRVLVWGGADRAEIYDPETGRFTLAPRMPAIDTAALERLGVPSESRPSDVYSESSGTPLALVDGDAAVIGAYASQWLEGAEGSEGDEVSVTQSFRFDAIDDQWAAIAEPYVARADDSGQTTAAWGTEHPCPIAVTLRGGRILCAGGTEWRSNGQYDDWLGIRGAALLDPATGAWSRLPRMPGPRIEAASVALADGGALIVGGYTDGSDGYPVGLKDAYRFVPPR